MAYLNPFKRDRKSSKTVPDRIDVSGTLYAVGDIHGMSALMNVMINFIREDAAKPNTPGPKTLVLMGDYIDRGEDSKGVLESLNALESDDDLRVVLLRGNHDVLMLNFVDDPIKHSEWLNWGGVQTLASFGVPPVLPTASDEELHSAATQLGDALGELRELISKRTVLMHRNGNVVCAHAGLRPDEPVGEQPEKVLLWGSRRFMDQGGPPGLWTVHGHFIVEKAAIAGNRIAVDTGAYATGVLSAARINRHGVKFIRVA